METLDTLMTMKKGRSRIDLEPVRWIGSPGSFMEQAMFNAVLFQERRKRSSSFAKKVSWKPSLS